MNYTILLIDDELEMCLSLSELLNSEGYATRYATSAPEALELLAQEHVDLILLDIRMPGMGGIDLLKATKQQNMTIPVIMITGYPTVEDAVCAMKYGALNVYTKPLKLNLLLKEIHELAGKTKRKRGAAPQQGCTIVTGNPKMHTILKAIHKAAPTPAPVLISGESGTGKELIAHSLHQQSRRAQKAFVKVNCAALPEDLLEAELFGHEKGAFTGAVQERKGRFELAHQGTIFLDEIGDMSLRTQAKILRVIQEHEFERVGGSKTLYADIRILAATNKNLRRLIEQKQFREDLYYRLFVISIALPPLRERKDDILLLADHFLAYYNALYQKGVRGLSGEVRWFFRSHDWPGNVRELKNCLERAIIFCERDSIEVEDLAAHYIELIEGQARNSYAEAFESLNRESIVDALERSGGVRGKAADLLNISRRTLYSRMKKLGLQ